MARLPQPGSDTGTWGQILNDYLSAVHNPDGTLKDNIIMTSSLAPDAVDASVIMNDSITEAKLDSAVQAKINAGTSNLVLGTTSTTAKAGDYAPSWTDVTSKPTTFTPAAHTHVIADTTGLQTALDQKITGMNGAIALWIGTQTEYDNLSTYSPTTLYVISGT